MELSVVIPARNEMFLSRTIKDLLDHSEAETEVIAVLDGAWANPAIPQDPRVNVIYLPESIGQRAATNIGVRLSKAKYVAKVDAHVSFDQGWDRKMIDGFKVVGDNVTMAPVMKNLWAFDWKCFHCGWKKYQGPTPAKCEQCGKGDKIRRKMMWTRKSNPRSTSFCFDKEPHFQYFEDYKHREPYLTDKKSGFTETMSLQGSFFMATREKYWELELSGEDIGSWGNQGLEVACKTWLSGGRVIINHNTDYAHMFRTQGGDFGFPYEQSGKHVSRTKKRVKDLLWEGKARGQTHRVSWLIEKFWPIPGWSQADLDALKASEKASKVV